MTTPIANCLAARAAAGLLVLTAGVPLSVAAAAAPSLEIRMALSEIKREELPDSDAGPPDAQGEPGPLDTVPLPDPIRRLPLPDTPATTPGAEEPEQILEQETPDDPDAPATEAHEIIYDLERLPEEVRRMRELIMQACLAGDPDALRPLIGIGSGATQLSFGGLDGDPIDFLREISGDDSGQEILAILLEVLDAGYVHLDPGTPNEIYVWPYFFAVPLEDLDPPQRVELFKIVTAGDYEDMKTYGAYNFYRVGISPEGRWLFFVAGD